MIWYSVFNMRMLGIMQKVKQWLGCNQLMLTVDKTCFIKFTKYNRLLPYLMSIGIHYDICTADNGTNDTMNCMPVSCT